jgi:hypothetical protein
MYAILKHLHSGLRWLVLFTLIWAVYTAYHYWKSGTTFNQTNKKAAFWGLSFVHLQAVVGIILYFLTPRIQFTSSMMKDSIMRFFGVEHPTAMLLAIILITIGYSRAKRSGSYKTIFIYYLIGLIILLISIPWPFLKYGSAWF